jgi:hypothetical protein
MWRKAVRLKNSIMLFNIKNRNRYFFLVKTQSGMQTIKDKVNVIEEMIIIPVTAVTLIYLLATTKIRIQEMAKAMKKDIKQRNLLLLRKNTNLLSLFSCPFSSCSSIFPIVLS